MSDETGVAQPTDQLNRCYRHPDRESFVRCQRCGRTICPQCQTLAAVGVHCPECVREARLGGPRTRTPLVTAPRALFRRSGLPVVTFVLMATAIVTYVLQFVFGAVVSNQVTYVAGDIVARPWTLLTADFGHGSILHIALNMYSLFVLGPIVETLLGRSRFLVLFLLSGAGGWVAVDFFSQNAALGASGAIFGLLGALFVIQRRRGLGSGSLISVIVINLVIGFVIPGIAWQAHVGGLLTGGLVAFVMLELRARRRRPLEVAAIAVVAIGMIVALYAHVYA
ncbi:rhomboid family intramembrane serine protease [Galbitalea soli]|uniref:rhomboid family intramembrane serine protease n=1 Tax=Galbitalea soli TaxID=1268042 RepID=UPI0018326B51|nr:membrane associated rhomboid family serine protease [Galbitalea soli]